MSFSLISLLNGWKSTPRRERQLKRRSAEQKSKSRRLFLEPLEDRRLLAIVDFGGQPVDITVSSPITESNSASLNGIISSPGTTAPFTLTVDWGDGSLPETLSYAAGTTSFNQTHQYLDDNPTATPSDAYSINVNLQSNGGSGLGGKIALEAGPNEINRTDTLPYIKSVLVSAGYTVDIVSGSDIDTAAEISEYSAVLIGDSGFGHDDWNTFGETLETYVNNGGGLLDSGMAPFFLSQPTHVGSGYSALANLLPVLPGTSTFYHSTVTPTAVVHPVTTGVSTWTAAASSSNGGGAKAGATVVAKSEFDVPAAVVWEVGQGRVVHLANNYLVSSPTYLPDHTLNQLNGTIPSALTMFLNSVAWVRGNAGGEPATASATLDVTVNNVAPILSTLTNSSPDCGQAFMGVDAVTIAVDFADAGTLDTHSVLIDWGDGNILPGIVTETVGTGVGVVSGSHVYATGGIFTISVTLADDDAGIATATTTATVGGIGWHDGQLQVIGTDGRDIVHVTRGGSGGGSDEGSDGESDGGQDEITVRARFNLPSTGGLGSVPRIVFNAGNVSSILIIGCGGDDYLHVGRHITVSSTIDGGAGDDQIWGSGANDTIVDLAGDNQIHAVQGDDSVIVGDGNNRIWTDGGSDTVHAGNGNNVILAGGGNNVIIAGNGNNEIHSGSGNDTITTGNGNNEIHAGGGDDTITTGSGDDRIWGDGGNDLIRAGAGNDIVNGGTGNDVILGEEGDDLLSGNQGLDVLIGGKGADFLFGNSGDDLLISGYTAFDANDSALLAIMSEWGSTSHSYADRVMNIMGLDGASVVLDSGKTLTRTTSFAARSNGGFFLNGADVNGVAGSQTVFSDASVDTITGNAGADWFLANITNEAGNDDVQDIITDLSNADGASDIDRDVL